MGNTLETNNQLILSGTVTRPPQTRNSPAGIPVSRFGLQHESRQQEAGVQRSVQCWIRVVVSGLALQDKVKGLAQGQRIRVSGFLARRGHRDPEAQLELHAQQIEWLD